MQQEIQSLHATYSTSPIFGIDFSIEEKVPAAGHYTMQFCHSYGTPLSWQAKPLSELKVPQQVEDVEIVDEEEVYTPSY